MWSAPYSDRSKQKRIKMFKQATENFEKSSQTHNTHLLYNNMRQVQKNNRDKLIQCITISIYNTQFLQTSRAIQIK